MKFHDIYSVGVSSALDLFNKVGWAIPAEAGTKLRPWARVDRSKMGCRLLAEAADLF